MDAEEKQILLTMLQVLDEIRKNIEILAKTHGNNMHKPKKNMAVELLLGRHKANIVDAQIIKEETHE
jgi:predicted nucleic acid-binding protein